MVMTIDLSVNGVRCRFDPASGESLLDSLRDRCGITSPKDGCQPQGQCGCCLVLIDGQPKTCCAVAVERCQGKSVLTLEGFSAEERDLTARAFASAAALQCGFCIPGLALRSKHLLDKNPDPSREEIARAIDGHLCRCTGYVKIVEAIQAVAAQMAGSATRALAR